MNNICLLLIICTAVQTFGLECLQCSKTLGIKAVLKDVKAVLGGHALPDCKSAKYITKKTCDKKPDAQKVPKCGMFTGKIKKSSGDVVIRDCFLVDKSLKEGTCISNLTQVENQLKKIKSALSGPLEGRFCINRSPRNQFPFWMLVFMFFTATFILN